jgi:fucose permease
MTSRDSGGKAYLACALSLNYAAMTCLAVAVNLLPVFLTTLETDLGSDGGLTHEQLGRLVGATFLGLCVGILLTGPLADRFGAKLFTLLGNLLVAGGLAVLGLAPDYLSVTIAVAIMGFGAGCLDMVLSPIVCALQPHRKGSAMNWLHSFYCIGAALTIVVASAGLRFGLGWRTIALWLVPVPVLVAAGFAFLRLPPLVAQGHDRMPIRQLVRVPYFVVAMLAIFFAGGTELGMAQWLPAYAEKTLTYTKFDGAMALLGFSVAMAIGRIGAGVIGHRVDMIKLMLACCAASVVLFMIACFWPTREVALAGAMAAGLTGSCLWPSMLAVTADRFPRGGASMFGALATLGNAGGIFAPWIVGVIADLGSMRWGLSTATICPLGMAVLLVWMRCRPMASHSPSVAKTETQFAAAGKDD